MCDRRNKIRCDLFSSKCYLNKCGLLTKCFVQMVILPCDVILDILYINMLKYLPVMTSYSTVLYLNSL